MSDAKKESDRRKAELELRRLMGSTQPPMAPDKPEPEPPGAEEIEAYEALGAKLDRALLEQGIVKSLDTDSPSKERYPSEDDTTPGKT